MEGEGAGPRRGLLALSVAWAPQEGSFQNLEGQLGR